MKAVPQSHLIAQIGTFAVPITCLSISSDSATLAVGTADGFLGFWDVSSAQKLYSFQLAHRVQSVAFSSDGLFFGVSLHNGTIYAGTYEGDLQEVYWGEVATTLIFLPDTSQLGFALGDGRLQLWDVASHHPVKIFAKTFTGPLSFLVPDARSFEVICSSDGLQVALNPHSQQGIVEVWTLGHETEPVVPEHQTFFRRTKTEFLGESQYRPSTYQLFFLARKTICGFDTQAMQPLAPIGPPHIHMLHFCFSPKGDMLACSDIEGSVYIWDIEHQQIMLQFAAAGDTILDDDAAVQCLTWFPQNNILATGGLKKKGSSFTTTVKLWQLTF